MGDGLALALATGLGLERLADLVLDGLGSAASHLHGCAHTLAGAVNHRALFGRDLQVEAGVQRTVEDVGDRPQGPNHAANREAEEDDVAEPLRNRDDVHCNSLSWTLTGGRETFEVNDPPQPINYRVLSSNILTY